MRLPRIESAAKEIALFTSDSEYRAALKEVEALMAAEFGTLEDRRLDVLVGLVEEYENRHYPL